MRNLAFFSFVTLTEGGPDEHAAYNRWHQLDHRPENLALPGVAWGDRWARTSECKLQGSFASEHAATDYVAMYWFNDPVAESLREWNQLAEDSFQWGRGPLIPGVERRLLSFFRPQRGYAAPDALVAPDVLPYRPHRGVHLTLTHHPAEHSAQTHDYFAWEDRVLMPGLLGVEGVAGGWTFSFVDHQRHQTMPFGDASDDAVGSMRIRLLYLDGDPLQVSPRLAEAHSGLTETSVAMPETLLSGPLKTIVPWQDW